MDVVIPTGEGSDERVPGPSRRQVLVTGGVVVAAAMVAPACGSSTPSPSETGTSAGAGGGTTIDASDVPVGGGEILAEQKVVITQPTAGTFKAFTAVCTHQGCVVASVADGLIECTCHNSRFSIADGSVQAGPAPRPLAEVPITVSGTTLTLA